MAFNESIERRGAEVVKGSPVYDALYKPIISKELTRGI